MSDEVVGAAFLARMDALTARLDAQAERIAVLEAENARLQPLRSAASSTPSGDGASAKVGRRGLIRQAVAATAAAAVLTVAKEAATAEAGTNATLTGASTANYGALGQAGTFAPSPIPNISSFTFGIVGISDAASFPRVPSAGAGLLGVANIIPAVYGVSATGFGVRGESTSGIGVYGASNGNHGSGGVTSTPGYSGLFGLTDNAASAGFLGVSSAAGGTAGYFVGKVYINGDFSATGVKSALVPHPDGSHRRLYCQEAPEPWFEDFGTAQLQGGRADIALDPDFDAVVDGTDYRVFLTEVGDLGGIYVGRKGPHRFEVRSRAGAAASGTFDYRIVAPRKDLKEQKVGRLEKVNLPQFDLRHPGLAAPAKESAR